MNEVIGTKNCLIMSGVNKWLVSPFRRHELWKYIVCILSAVTYGKKGLKISIEIPKRLVIIHQRNHKEMFAEHIFK